jgi:hypothetical protein
MEYQLQTEGATSPGEIAVRSPGSGWLRAEKTTSVIPIIANLENFLIVVLELPHVTQRLAAFHSSFMVARFMLFSMFFACFTLRQTRMRARSYTELAREATSIT